MSRIIGKSTDPKTAQIRADVSGSAPPSFRYFNPGAQYPSGEAARFGQIGYGIIGGGHKIARFSSPVNGAAANFDLLCRKYAGMTIGVAGKTWTGSLDFGVPGYPPTEMLTQSMLNDPEQAIAFLKAIAHRESGRGNNLTEEEWRQAHAMFTAGSADDYLAGRPVVSGPAPTPGTKTGAGLVERARRHIGSDYEHGVVPKNDPNWTGPWDCAEFVSWLVFQEAGMLYGCLDNSADPALADAYTGAWKRDVDKRGARVSVQRAAATIGGIVLRFPPGGDEMGHIALCDGKGGTIEARGKRYGVVAGKVSGRRWDAGVLIPGISYQDAAAIELEGPAVIYEIGAPNMDPEMVRRLQRALLFHGFDPRGVDGDFGPNTQGAVIRFQRAEGLVVDGAVGPETAGALGIDLRRGPAAAESGTTTETAIPAVPDDLASLLPLLTALAATLTEKTMATDPAKPGQAADILLMLLALLLQPAMSGRQPDLKDILTALLGKSGPQPIVVPQPQPQPAPVPAPQGQPDVMQMLLALLLQRMIETQKGSGGEPPKPAPPLQQQPVPPAQPALARPSVQLGLPASASPRCCRCWG